MSLERKMRRAKQMKFRRAAKNTMRHTEFLLRSTISQMMDIKKENVGCALDDDGELKIWDTSKLDNPVPQNPETIIGDLDPHVPKGIIIHRRLSVLKSLMEVKNEEAI